MSPARHDVSGIPGLADALLLKAIKGIHTLAWSSIEACMVYVLYAGFARRSAIHAPLIVLAGYLRARNLRHRRRPI